MPASARSRTIAFWAFPPLLALALYWPGLTAWFQKDDFAWLGLRALVHNWHDLRWALFAPLAQGTVRTLSERVFYMSFGAVFGLHALPYRCLAFATFAASLPLLTSITAKLTGSRAAGFWAAIFWTVNSAMAYALAWTAIYYQLLCAFNFLLSFWLLLRYVETGERRFYTAQCVTFILGFGILELNVVYPALALAYALCRARRITGKIVPLFVFSGIYTWIHMAAAPLHTSGPYRMFWDASIFSTLWTYWKYALGPNRLIFVGIHPSIFRSALMFVLMAGLLWFLACKLSRREWLAAFFPAWFLIVLAPLLPLRDHITDSYLTIPLIGLAMWGGWAVASGWRAGLAGRIAAVALLTIYVCVSAPVTRVVTAAVADRSHEIHKLLLSLVSLSRSEPGKIVLLKGLDSQMFWDAFFHRPLRLFGINEVYLVPEDEPRIDPDSQRDAVRKFFMPPAVMKEALDANRAVVFQVRGDDAREITNEYRETAAR